METHLFGTFIKFFLIFMQDSGINTLQHFNQACIGHMLTINSGNVTQAAHACGMERQALQQIMRHAIDAGNSGPDEPGDHKFFEDGDAPAYSSSCLLRLIIFPLCLGKSASI
jgi:hypothetical protein